MRVPLPADRAAPSSRTRQQPRELAPLVLVVRGEDQLQAPLPPSLARRALSRARRRDRLLLRGAKALDAAGGERQQLVEMGARERRALGSRLHLDQAAVAGHHDVGVDLGNRVLGVVEIEKRPPVDHPAGDRRDRAGQRGARERPVGDQPRTGQRQRDVGSRDRRAARAAVCLEHVAVEVDRAFAQRLEVDHAAQRAPDQALDLHGAPILAAPRGVALLAVARRGREHPVLGGHPPAAVSGHPARHALLRRRGADHARLPDRDQRRAGRRAHEARLDLRRAKLVESARVAARCGARGGRAHATAPARASATCSHRSQRHLQEARAALAKDSASPVHRKR